MVAIVKSKSEKSETCQQPIKKLLVKAALERHQCVQKALVRQHLGTCLCLSAVPGAEQIRRGSQIRHHPVSGYEVNQSPNQSD